MTAENCRGARRASVNRPPGTPRERPCAPRRSIPRFEGKEGTGKRANRGARVQSPGERSVGWTLILRMDSITDMAALLRFGSPIRYIEAIRTPKVNGRLTGFRHPGANEYEGFFWQCRRAVSFARSARGPSIAVRRTASLRSPMPGLMPLSFSAGSCCLSAPEGRLGACAWALRGFAEAPGTPERP